MATLSLFHRNTQHTINGINAYQLLTSQGSTSANTMYTAPENTHAQTQWVRSHVRIRKANGVLVDIGLNVAQYTYPALGGAGLELWQATWNCPATAILPTDALQITVDVGIGSFGFASVTFITGALGASMLNATTWTFRYSIQRAYFSDEEMSRLIFWWGTTTYNSGISGVSYETNQAPAAPTITSPAHAIGYTLNLRPQFKATITDPDANTLTQVELQVAANTGFSSGVQTFTFNGAWASGSTVILTPTVDITTGTRYARIRAYDGQVWGNYSVTLQILIKTEAQVWSVLESQIASGVIMAGPVSWLTEARAAVNAARAFRGLSAQVWTDAAPVGGATAMRGTHLREIRSALVAALSTVGTNPVWTDTTIVDLLLDRSNLAQATDKRGEHLKDIMIWLRSV